MTEGVQAEEQPSTGTTSAHYLRVNLPRYCSPNGHSPVVVLCLVDNECLCFIVQCEALKQLPSLGLVEASILHFLARASFLECLMAGLSSDHIACLRGFTRGQVDYVI